MGCEGAASSLDRSPGGAQVTIAALRANYAAKKEPPKKEKKPRHRSKAHQAAHKAPQTAAKDEVQWLAVDDSVQAQRATQRRKP